MRDRVLTWLADHVPPARLQHSLGVEQMCIELAEYYALNIEQAAQAGLMHDLAKYFKPTQLLHMARQEGIEVDPICETNPHLLHADVSAIVARDELGINDEVILEAIALHTLGRPGMSELSCIVFLADSLEPGRGDTLELATLRQATRQNLHKAIWLTCDYSLKFLVNTRRFIHPRTILTRNWAVQMFNKKNQSTDRLTEALAV